MPKEKPRPTIRLMFKHRILDQKGKPSNLFVLVDENFNTITEEEETDGFDNDCQPVKVKHSRPAERLYSRNGKATRGTKLANPMAGGVYQVDVGDNGTSVYPGSAKYIGRIASSKKIAELQAIDRTNRDLEAAIKAEKKEHNRDLLAECLAPLRNTYRQLHGAQRTIFLSNIVRYVAGQS